MSKVTVLPVLFAATLAVGCVPLRAPVVPPVGWAFNNSKAPLDLDYQKTDLGSKVGRASTTTILGLFSWGDASTTAAMANGNLQEARHADYEYLNVFYLYQSFTLVVRGE
jgi:hypothetical protein